MKTFGYPEFFVPGHHLPEPLREGALVEPAAHAALLDAGAAFVARLVERYRDRQAIVAWQVEHDAVDPLGMEHSWRLSAAFVRREVEAVRAADPTRPVLMNGFLPTSAPVRLQQWWRTRDQGDSLVVAQQLADLVGVDFYPRHAVVAAAGWTVYLAGRVGALRWRRQLLRWAAARRLRSAGPFPVAEDQRAHGHEDRGQPGDGHHVEHRARGHHLGVARDAGVERGPAQFDRVTQRHEPAHDADEGGLPVQRHQDAAQHVLRDDQELEDLHRRTLVGQRRDGGEPERAAEQAAGQRGRQQHGQLPR